jgi:hypothetical protein
MAYPSSVISFSLKVDNDDIEAEHVNTPQTEITAIEDALLNGFAHALKPSTHNTRDLGLTGTRWKDLFLAGNADIDGTLDVAGAATVAGTAYIGDTSNTKVTLGLTINQAGADNEILALKSSDVAHGITDVTETDTYALFSKFGAPDGGVTINGLTEQGTGVQILSSVTAEDATRSTAGVAPTMLSALLKSGTTIAAMSANVNLVAIRSASVTRFILDSDGDSHQDVGTAWTNFDDADDIERLDAVAVALAPDNDPLRAAFVDQLQQARETIAAMPGKPLVAFNGNGHHFVNMSRLAMLHHGAIRQLARQNAALRAELADLHKRLDP